MLDLINECKEIIVFSIIGLTIGGSIIATLITTAILDKFQPERLERFKLEQYQEGVKDATQAIKVNK